MQLARTASAVHPRHFGRGPQKHFGESLGATSFVRGRLSEDLKLFATTFAAGFIFVSVLFG